MTTIRKKLADFIKKQNMTNTQFALENGVSISQLSQIISGKQYGTFDFWLGIAERYDLTVRDLVALYEGETKEVTT